LRYRLGMADGAHGPGDVQPLVLTDGGTIPGPDIPNWQGEYILGLCEEAVTWRGASVKYLAISPRYVGTTLTDIRHAGGIVGVGRVLPEVDARLWKVSEDQGPSGRGKPVYRSGDLPLAHDNSGWGIEFLGDQA
jgi:hypothetical protein